jgi:hypothetical protein
VAFAEGYGTEVDMESPSDELNPEDAADEGS